MATAVAGAATEIRRERAPRDPAATIQRLGVEAGFLLAVGHLEARKNYATLIKAMAAICCVRRGLSLVIVGQDGGERAALVEQVRKAGLDQAVTFPNGVNNVELIDLYHAARLVVFPSRYEGFGITLLEPMAARRPIATSDTDVFVELSEGPGVTFPTDDSAAIARAVLRLLDNPARLQQLID